MSDGSKLVQRAKDLLHGFEIFETDAIDNVGVIFELAEIVISVAVKCINTEGTVQLAELRAKRQVFNCGGEAATNIIPTQLIWAKNIESLECEHKRILSSGMMEEIWISKYSHTLET